MNGVKGCSQALSSLSAYSMRMYNSLVDKKSDEGQIERALKSILSALDPEERDRLMDALKVEGKYVKCTDELLNEFRKNDDETSGEEISTGDSSFDSMESLREANKKLTKNQMLLDSYIVSSRVIAKIKNAFRDKVFSECLCDWRGNGSSTVNKLEKLSATLTKLKITLCEKLLEELKPYLGDQIIELDTKTDANLTSSIRKVIDVCTKVLSSAEVRVKKPTALERCYALAYFDRLLSELDFVTKDKKFGESEHGWNEYSFSYGKSNVRTQVMGKTDVAIDMDSVSSNFLKEFMSYLPLIQSTIDDTHEIDELSALWSFCPDLKIGWQGFHRAAGAFMQWLSGTGVEPRFYKRVVDGDPRAFSDAIMAWGRDKGVTTYSKNTNMMVLDSLRFWLFSPKSPLPQEIKSLYIAEILKTNKHSYLGYNIDDEGRVSSTLCEDRQILSESSDLSNMISGTVSSIIRNPFAYNLDSLVSIVPSDNGSDWQINFKGKFRGISISVTTETLESKDKKSYKVHRFSGRGRLTSAETMELILFLFKHDLGFPTEADDLKVLDTVLQTSPLKINSLFEVLAPVIGVAISAASNKISDDDKVRGSFSFLYKNETYPILNKYFRDYDKLAFLLYHLTGYDNKNVVRDVSNNKVPVYALISAIYQYKRAFYNAKDSSGVYASIRSKNPLLAETIEALNPLIRNGLVTRHGKKSSSDLNTSELFITAAFIDYYQSLLAEESKDFEQTQRANRVLNGRTLLIQPTVFSDKSQQFIIPFQFKNSGDPILNALKRLVDYKGLTKEERLKFESIIESNIYQWQNAKYEAILKSVCDKWQRVYNAEIKAFSQDKEFTSVYEKIDSFIDYAFKTWGERGVRAKFDGVADLTPELDYSKSNREIYDEDGNLILDENNQPIKTERYGLNIAAKKYYDEIFATQESTHNFFELQKRILINDIYDNGVSIWQDTMKIKKLPVGWIKDDKIVFYKIYKKVESGYEEVTDKINPSEILNPDGSINWEYEIELNPIVNSYQYADGICSQAFEEIFFGFNENNPDKKKASDILEDSSYRLLSQYKRTVPAGSTVHLYLQGMKNGVSKKMRCAVVDDVSFEYATNAIGEVFKKDPHDGSAWASPLWAIWCKNSLLSAAAGTERAKTIHHDVDANGNGILCKWATFTITNAIRRASGLYSRFSAEKLFRQMHDVLISPNLAKTIRFDSTISNNPIFTYDPIAGEGRKIVDFINDRARNTIVVRYYDATEDGETIGDVKSQEFSYENGIRIWELDQILGGAFAKRRNSKTGELEFSDVNNEMLCTIIENLSTEQHDLREDIIAYIINASAIKRGATNVNDSKALEGNTKLRTMMIRTSMGGLMMDTEHDVDGHVRETSQMMSSLTQLGYSTAEATKIYTDIGEIVKIMGKTMFKSINNLTDRTKIIESIVLDAITSSKNKGIGISDSITRYKYLDTGEAVPFSLADVRSKFINACNAYLTNKGVIRKYPGVQSVNAPSRGMIQYFSFKGYNYDFSGICKKIHEVFEEDPILVDTMLRKAGIINTENRIRTATELALQPYITKNGEIISVIESPFLNRRKRTKVQIGETVIYKSAIDGKYHKVILDSAKQTDEIKYLRDDIEELYIHSTAPVDLKQPHITFEVSVNGSNNWGTFKFNEWDLDVVRALWYFRDKKVCGERNKTWQYADKKQQLIDKVLLQVFANKKNKILFKRHGFDESNNYDGISDDLIIKGMINVQQDLYNSWDAKNKIKDQVFSIRHQEAFSTVLEDGTILKSDVYDIRNVEVSPGEIAISPAYAKLLGLKVGDNIGEIMSRGAEFFASRLHTPIDDLDRNVFDAILVEHSGQKVYVKIAENSNDIEGFTEDNENVEIGVSSVYYKDAEVASIEDYLQGNIKFGTYRSNEQSVGQTMIVVKNSTILAELEGARSIFNSKETRFNYTRDNYIHLLAVAGPRYLTETGEYKVQLSNGEVPIRFDIDNPNLELLQKIEERKNAEYINRRSIELFNAFKASLKYIGTRIPSQALQSCMALKVAMFIGDPSSNQIYVPGAMTWFQGADYDIDKTYMMRLGLNGARVDVLSDLTEEGFSYEQCANLQLPDSKLSFEVEVCDPDNALVLGVQDRVNNGERVFFNGIHFVPVSKLGSDDDMFTSIKKILDDCKLSEVGGKRIMVVNDVDIKPKDAKYRAYRLHTLLDIHNNTSLSNKRTVQEALLNRNVVNAYDIMLDPRNFIASSEPISFGKIGDFAEKSPLGGREKRLSIWGGMTKWIMQDQFMIGKKEIGIIATAIKTYLGKNSVANECVLSASKLIKAGQVEEGLKLLSKYMFVMDFGLGGKHACLLANVNLDPLEEAIHYLGTNKVRAGFCPPKLNVNGLYSPSTGEYDLLGLIDELRYSNAEEDVLMALSSLLSAATDNAKELILSKINASTSTVDLFCSMLGSGFSLQEILDTFSSPLFSLASKLTETNLYTESTNNVTLTSAINQILGEGTTLNGKNQYRLTELFNCEQFLFTEGRWNFDLSSYNYYRDNIINISDETKDSSKDYRKKLMLLILSNPENESRIIENLNKFRDEIYKLNNIKKSVNSEDDSEYDDEYDYDIDNDANNDSDEEYGENPEDYSDEPEDEGYVVRRNIPELSFADFDVDDIHTFLKYFEDIRLINSKIAKIKKDILEEVRTNNNFPKQDDKIRYVQEVLANQLKSLEFIRDSIIPIADENKILGRIMKINQGLVSTLEEEYSLVKGIENHFTNVFENNGHAVQFNLYDFLVDESVQREMIELYDRLPSKITQINPLRVMVELPNFREMFKMYSVALDLALEQFDSYFSLTLADAVVDNIYNSSSAHTRHKLSEQEFQVVRNVVREATPFVFLNTLPDEIKMFSIKAGEKYCPNDFDISMIYGSYEADEDMEINLASTEGANSFIYWVENEIFHELKKKFPNNAFVKSLRIETLAGKRTKKISSAMRVGIDMTNVETSHILGGQFNGIINGFDAIADEILSVKGKPMTIGDIIYLYNLIKNKGNLGKTSFGKLYQNYLVSNISENTILNRWWNFLRVLDNSKNSELKTEYLSMFNVNELVMDCLWKFAFYPEMSRKVNLNSNQTVNRIQKLKTGNGYQIDGITKQIGEGAFDLPFITEAVYRQDRYNDNGDLFRTHEMSPMEVQTRLLTELEKFVTENGTPVIVTITSESLDNLNLNSEDLQLVKFMTTFVHEGKVYVNLDRIDQTTPSTVLLSIMSLCARYVKDEDGNYIYRDKWNKLLETFENNKYYDSYRRDVLKNSVTAQFYQRRSQNSITELALARFISDQLLGENPFEVLNNKRFTDEDYEDYVARLVNKLYGLEVDPEYLEAFNTMNVGKVLQLFGPLTTQHLSTTIIEESARMKQLMSWAIKNNKIKFEGDC